MLTSCLAQKQLRVENWLTPQSFTAISPSLFSSWAAETLNALTWPLTAIFWSWLCATVSALMMPPSHGVGQLSAKQYLCFIKRFKFSADFQNSTFTAIYL